MTDLLTVAETSKILRISTKTCYRLIQSGQLPHIKIRGTIRISKIDLELFILTGGEQLE